MTLKTFVLLIVLCSWCLAEDRGTRLNSREEEKRSDRVRKAQRKLDHELTSFLDWCKTRSMLLTMSQRGEYVCIASPDKPADKAADKPAKPETK